MSVILIILAPIAFITSLQKTEGLRSSGIETTAEIIEFNWETTVESEKTIISFTDQSGSVHTMPLGFYSSNMYIGMKVPILYDPDDTSTIMYIGGNSLFNNYEGSIMLLIGAVISVMSVPICSI